MLAMQCGMYTTCDIPQHCDKLLPAHTVSEIHHSSMRSMRLARYKRALAAPNRYQPHQLRKVTPRPDLYILHRGPFIRKATCSGLVHCVSSYNMRGSLISIRIMRAGSPGITGVTQRRMNARVGEMQATTAIGIVREDSKENVNNIRTRRGAGSAPGYA